MSTPGQFPISFSNENIMGRLQRKKTSAGIRKRKKKNETKLASSHEKGTGEVKRINQFSDSGTVLKKKLPISKIKPQSKKPGSVDRGKILGYLDLSVQFLREVKIELKKVTWPSRKQTMGSSTVVIILVLLISLFLFFIDSGLAGIIRLVLHSN